MSRAWPTMAEVAAAVNTLDREAVLDLLRQVGARLQGRGPPAYCSGPRGLGDHPPWLDGRGGLARSLIAMKLRAMRSRDMEDLDVLFRLAGITSPEQAARFHDRLFSEADIGYGGADESLFAARLVFGRARRAGRPIAS